MAWGTCGSTLQQPKLTEHQFKSQKRHQARLHAFEAMKMEIMEVIQSTCAKLQRRMDTLEKYVADIAKSQVGDKARLDMLDIQLQHVGKLESRMERLSSNLTDAEVHMRGTTETSDEHRDRIHDLERKAASLEDRCSAQLELATLLQEKLDELMKKDVEPENETAEEQKQKPTQKMEVRKQEKQESEIAKKQQKNNEETQVTNQHGQAREEETKKEGDDMPQVHAADCTKDGAKCYPAIVKGALMKVLDATRPRRSEAASSTPSAGMSADNVMLLNAFNSYLDDKLYPG